MKRICIKRAEPSRAVSEQVHQCTLHDIASLCLHRIMISAWRNPVQTVDSASPHSDRATAVSMQAEHRAQPAQVRHSPSPPCRQRMRVSLPHMAPASRCRGSDGRRCRWLQLQLLHQYRLQLRRTRISSFSFRPRPCLERADSVNRLHQLMRLLNQHSHSTVSMLQPRL